MFWSSRWGTKAQASRDGDNAAKGHGLQGKAELVAAASLGPRAAPDAHMGDSGHGAQRSPLNKHPPPWDP